MKVLMVCLGNICRSPLAEGILKKLINEKNIPEIIVDSCGTSDYHIGEQPDKRSIKVAHDNGLDISGQRCRQFVKSDFEEFDFILVMDESNYENVVRLTENPEHINKVHLILSYLNKKGDLNVPDPYYLEYDGFEQVYAMLDKACNNFIENEIH